jgi:hypothetical protein
MASIHIDEQTAESLARRAAEQGVTVNELLTRLLRQEIRATQPNLSADELERILDEEATEAPLLPADFSRADMYAEHD